MTMTTVLLIPDLQVPLQDQRFVDKLVSVTQRIQPDALGFIGDVTDSTQVGQWVKGKSGEFDGGLQEAFDVTKNTLSRFRKAAPEAAMWIQWSNHDLRTQSYVRSNAPALSSLRCLEFGALVGADTLGITVQKKPFEFLPGAVAVHGHERRYSSVPGKYGIERVKEYGKSVVYGHTHQPLLVGVNQGYNGKLKSRFAMNVGHAMDVKKAGYLGDGYANWQQAFGIVRSDGRNLYPELVTATNGKFLYGGELW